MLTLESLTDDLKTLWSYARPYRWSLLLASGLMLGQSITSLAVPWLAGQLTTGLLPGDANQSLPINLMFISLLALFAIHSLLTVGHNYLLVSTDEQICSELRTHLYDHLQSLPLSYYHEHRKGDALTLLTHDVEALSGFIGTHLVNILPLMLTFLGALVMMIHIDWMLGCLAGAVIPPLFLLLKLMTKQLRPLSKRLADAHADAMALAEENLNLLPIIKAYTQEKRESNRYRKQARKVLALGKCYALATGRLEPVIQFGSTAGIILLLWLAGGRVESGDISPAELVSFFMYGLLLTRPMGGLASLYGGLRQARTGLSRLKEAWQVPAEPNPETDINPGKVLGDVEFKQILFAYPDRPPIFQDLNLRITAGETVTLTGVNGVGKTTVANLLMRFYTPCAGSVLIDGVDTAKISLENLRSYIGLVPQHILLFNTTIGENIAYGSRENPALSSIESAAKAAGAHAFISTLPDGYDTVIGEGGVKLSGGQQQRIALARALIKDPPILVLDEATSMFDPEGEAEFLNQSRDILRDRTVIIISHRPTTLNLADRILHMQNGQVFPEHVLE